MQQTVRFQIEGMTCQACASRIEKVLNKKDFIQSAGVNFASEEAQVVFDDRQYGVQDIVQLIQKTGYQAIEKTAALPQAVEKTKMSWRLGLLLVINLPFLFGMLLMMLGRHEGMLPPLWQFMLASVVQLWLAIPFYQSAWASIKGGLANMDVLVSIGTLAIYAYSVFMLWRYGLGHESMGRIYFEASVMVIGFVSLGKFLEQRSKKASLNSLSLMLQLTPSMVSVQREGRWQSLPLDLVQSGDVLRANQGERIAADGVVESGSAWADESHLTGEFNPEMKTVGSRVLAGALISDGSIVYRAKQLGSETLLGDMMNALSQAQGSKAPIARVADKAAAVFVPVVLGIALLTFGLTWGLKNDWQMALMHAVAVLVIACPCALGLATPAAVMVGMGKAVAHGIWFKDAAAMEEAARVNAVVLDKTGTLTQGRPQVLAVYQVPDSGFSTQDLYRMAAAVEEQARHPLARAIVQAANEQGLSWSESTNVQQVVGEGVCADVLGVGRVKVGKAAFVGLELPEDLETLWQVASVVALSVDEKAIAAFALADALKTDSAAAVKRLQAQGIAVYVMSGDNERNVAYVAAQLGIDQAFGDMSPRDKATAIKRLQAEGQIVAMVGDGVNDAPALAVANVSFAMKDGADVAEHSASATLMQHSLNQLADALLIARATLKNIKQNLFFAFFYNVLGIPLAALGFLSPIIAGAAMALSSISVLGNALRLKRQKIAGNISKSDDK